MRHLTISMATMVLSLFAHGEGLLTINSEGARHYGSVLVGASGMFEKGEQAVQFTRWNFSFAASQLEVEEGGGASVEVLRSHDLATGVGIRIGKSIKVDGSIFGGATPETNFTHGGGALDFSYDFSSRFTVGIGLGGGKIRQNLVFPILGIEREVELDQREQRAFANLAPADWLLIKLDLRRYEYSKSNEDIRRAFQRRLLNTYATELISSIASLPEYSGALEFVILIGESWDLDIYSQAIQILVEENKSNRTELVLTRHFLKWSLGGGVSRNKTPTTLDGALLLNLSFEI